MFLQKIFILSSLFHVINGDFSEMTAPGISEETGEFIDIESPHILPKQCTGCKASVTTHQSGDGLGDDGRQPDCLKLEWNGVNTDGECGYEERIDMCTHLKKCTFYGDVVITNNCDFEVVVNEGNYLDRGRLGAGESKSYQIGDSMNKPKEMICGNSNELTLPIQVLKYVEADGDKDSSWDRIAKFQYSCSHCDKSLWEHPGPPKPPY
jgi:hypothetical protein